MQNLANTSELDAKLDAYMLQQDEHLKTIEDSFKTDSKCNK